MSKIYKPLILLVLITQQVSFAQSESLAELAATLDSIHSHNLNIEPQKVDELIQRSKEAYSEKAPAELRYLYHYNLGNYYLDRGAVQQSERSFLKADSLAIAEGLPNTTRVRGMSGLGNLYKIAGDFDKSIECQLFALKHLNIKDKDSSGYYATLINLSNSYSARGEIQTALNYLLRAKKFFSKLEDGKPYAIILNNIGEVYRTEFKDYPSAIRHLLEAKKINENSGDQRNLGSNLNNLALAYNDLGQSDSALYYANETVALKKSLNDIGGLAQSLFTRGSVHSKNGALLEAEADFRESLKQCEELQIYVGIYYNLAELAKISNEKGFYKEALTHLNRAESINREIIKSPQEESAVGAMKSEVYRNLKDYSNAYSYFVRSQGIKDSLAEVNNQKEIAVLRSEHEKDLALAENEVLRLKEKAQAEKLGQNRIMLVGAALLSLLLLILSWRMYKLSESRKKANLKLRESEKRLREEIEKVARKSEELAQSNTMKNQILSVMGHDLRSPLASVAGLLSTISAEEITREELQGLLALLKTETDRSLNSLQNVLHWARLQMDEVKIFRSELNLPELIEEITYQYGPGKRSKNLEIEFIDELHQAIWADEHQFKSMCGNLLSNAIKFSPDGAKIRIKAEKLKDAICISVCDEGSGIDPETLEKLNNHQQLKSTRGTKGESGTGIGLRIVYDFIEIHGGSLEFENLPEGGTCAKLLFPLRSKLEA